MRNVKRKSQILRRACYRSNTIDEARSKRPVRFGNSPPREARAFARAYARRTLREILGYCWLSETSTLLGGIYFSNGTQNCILWFLWRASLAAIPL